MTIAVCTHCGKLKQGALCSCSECGAESIDAEISILLSDHNLSVVELRRIGQAVAAIQGAVLDEEMQHHALLYFLSRKWPKLLDYNIGAVEPKIRRTLDTLYGSRLAQIEGQKDPDLKVSPILEQTWATASGADFQAEDDAWQADVRGILLRGMDLATQLFALRSEAGEGAVLERVLHGLKTTFRHCDYRTMAATGAMLVRDSEEYGRTVDAFCSRIRNGWSERTKAQAAYFRGLCSRLEELARYSHVIIEHKAGINTLTKMDLEHTRQKFTLSYGAFLDLSKVVIDPSRIGPTTRE